MGRRKKAPEGFNTPFAGVTLPEPPPEPEPPAPPARSSEETDADAFAAAMAGVEPIDRGAGRVEPAKRTEAALPDDEQEALLELVNLVEGDGPFRFVDAEEVHAGMAPGVSRELLDKLQRGAFSTRRHLDLHGLSRVEAKPRLIDFLVEARRDGERCVLVVTGRGRSSPDGISVLREILPRWLSRSPLRAHVLAFSTALQADGGPGAYYVLLRRPGVKPYGTVG
jgi:DNA-nicking Smr family endonuclease